VNNNAIQISKCAKIAIQSVAMCNRLDSKSVIKFSSGTDLWRTFATESQDRSYLEIVLRIGLRSLLEDHLDVISRDFHGTVRILW